jgi:endonuclease/exonuclease/phosphatase (EEP) superfamily protein YafD
MTGLHRHRWHVIDRTVLDSPLDKLLARGLQNFKSHSAQDTETLTHRPVIVTYRCERCEAEKVVRV